MDKELENRLLRAFSEEFPCCGKPELVRDTLIHLSSPLRLELPVATYGRIERAVKDLYRFAHSEPYIEELKSELPASEAEILKNRPKYSSVLMAYDFHYEPETDRLSLIEINTNASAFMFADLLNRQAENKHWLNAKSDLLESFKADGLTDQVTIIDEDVPKQKMYPEFLLYCDWFNQNGFPCSIKEAKSSEVIDGKSFIYNRFNDFVLTDPASRHLREAYLTGKQVFSPSPHEFILMADKLRLFKFAENNVSDVLVPMRAFTDFESLEQLWSERKNYFFKPKRLYGGKAVFRGSSISKTRFQSLQPENYLAQEHRPPGQLSGFKFDMRFFAYKDQIQLGIARFFKGQLLNFNDPDGGLGPIALI